MNGQQLHYWRLNREENKRKVDLLLHSFKFNMIHVLKAIRGISSIAAARNGHDTVR